jgi:A/G-specific adenine glycosylase
MIIDRRKKEEFVKNLLVWYSKNKRVFSWRNKTNPFHILVAEIMLQKTDVKKVSEVYDKFIERHPTPQDLASAELSELRKELALLGIHKRAERMKKLAEKIIFEYGGEVPSEKEELLKLPGVGEYIANAVLCFAFSEDVPIVDTNVIRLLDRVFGVKSSKSRPRTDRKIWEFAAELVPKGKCREYNQALLDFAASLCTSKNPLSDICPENKICSYAKDRSA